MNTLKSALSTYHSTIGGIVLTFFGFVIYAPEHFNKWPVILDIANYGAAGGLAAIGIGAYKGIQKS